MTDFTTRACRACGEVKPLTTEHFPRDGSQKSGFKSLCLICRRAQRREHYAANAEVFSEQKRLDYQKHREVRLEENRAAYQKNRAARDQQSAAWARANPERTKEIRQMSKSRQRARLIDERGVYCSCCRQYHEKGQFSEVRSRGNRCMTCVEQDQAPLIRKQYPNGQQRILHRQPPVKDRTCVECRVFKSAAEFGTTRHAICTECRTRLQKQRDADRARRKRAAGPTWQQLNRERSRAYMREYVRALRQREPLQAKMRNAAGALRRKAQHLMILAPGKTHTHQLVQLWQAQNGKCRWCKTPLKHDETTHLDHIIPLIKGGDNRMSNLCWTCRDCNGAKSDQLPHEFAGVLF